MQARDIMTRNVITVTPDLPVRSLATLLVEHRISGAPVLDSHRQLVGMVTEGDLCRRVELGTLHRRSRWAELFIPKADLAAEFVHEHGHTVGDIMTARVIHVGPDARLEDIATLLETLGIKRLPVLEKGQLVGLVSRANLVQALASGLTTLPSSAEQDRNLRDEILLVFKRHPWGLKSESNVIVQDGRVHLWGLVGSEAERTALRLAATAVHGVLGIEDHTILAGDGLDRGTMPSDPGQSPSHLMSTLPLV